MSCRNGNVLDMNNNVLQRIFLFYKQGFMQMDLGRTLWVIILVKLFVIFFVLKLFFFPDVLSQKADEDKDKADIVQKELLDRYEMKNK